MRTLVTGATGFIGRTLTTQLVADPANDVAILVRGSYRGQPLPQPLDQLGDRLVTLFADLRDLHETRRAVRSIRPDVIFHLAASGAGDPFLPVDLAIEQNLNTLLNLLRAAFEQEGSEPARQLIVVRTPGEVSAMNPYAASKAAAWGFCLMYARTRGWPIVGAMPFQTYGPGQGSQALVSGAMSAALAGEDFELTAGQQQRDWIYVNDVASGLLAIRDAQLPAGTSVDLGTGRLTSVATLVEMVYELAGGEGQPLIGALPSRTGEDASQVADSKRTQDLIGWQASVSLEQGLQQYLNHLRRRQT